MTYSLIYFGLLFYNAGFSNANRSPMREGYNLFLSSRTNQKIKKTIGECSEYYGLTF